MKDNLEAKFYNDVSKALDSAFKSIEDFHDNAMHLHEYNLVTTQRNSSSL